MKNFYEQLDTQQNNALRNLDILMRDLDSMSSLDLEDMYYDNDEY